MPRQSEDAHGRVAWITGASAGIGRALALQLAGRGYRVAVTARRRGELEALAQSMPRGIFAFPGDVTVLPSMRATVATIERDLGPIEVAILNAGYYRSDYHVFDANEVRHTLEINLGGTVNCLDPLLAAMVARTRGRIAIVASMAGYGGIPGSVSYSAAKSALITLAEALRLTYARSGLVIQVINPGFVDTAMTADNDYSMPLMMSAERAAKSIAIGLEADRFEIAFPRRLALLAKAATLLPYGVWLPLMRWSTRRVAKDD